MTTAHACRAVTIQKKIFRLSAACAVLIALAFVVPRAVPNTEGGFASGATAALVFLAGLAVTGIVSLYLLWITIRGYRDLSPLARVAGIGPSVIVIGGLVALLILLRY
jgi:hypothetical protein